ncbi:MAG TPA: DNA polymerase III subunit alpha [Dissulfurispiraceae bacterium]|nr:DNA polymerase III subunit alpha [Dissulfurispiraceae bacterium]
MQHADFVPLHLHTEYSLLDGAIKIDELLEQAVLYKMPAVAITDHGNLFGAIDFYSRARKKGIKPIIGCEVYVAPQSRLDRVKTNIDNLAEEAAFHLILLARNIDGYRNLTSMVAKAYLEGFYYKPRIDKDLLEQYSGGLIALSACLKGEVPYYLQIGNIDKAREVALHYKHLFGPDNFYLEIQTNGMTEQEEVNRKVIDLAAELHIPVVATNDCHYLRKDDARAHDILLCIQTGKTFKDEKRMRFSTEELYFKSPDEMKEAFSTVPEAISNTVMIAERCNVEFELGKFLLPRYTPPDGMRPSVYLESLAREGLKERFGAEVPKEYLDRLALELEVIKKMGFASYFLIVWDFINYAKSKGIPVGPGRGSAAGSLVAYCLTITELDPIKYNLLFERFLNPERISMPDIDVDFCKDRRQEVINYVSEKYGHDNVAQIITFGTMASKAAVRDVGRVLDIPYAEVDKISKLIPTGPEVKSLDDALKIEPRLKELYNTNPQIKEMIDIAKRLEGLSRHASTHAAGVVIAPDPLTHFTALYKNPAEEVVTTQFDMKSIEKMGLLKFDFLGLKTLTIMDKTVQFIRQQGGDIALSSIPVDDEETYRYLTSGETTGIFQLESAGMRDILARMQPSRFEDLIALVALYRPGPMGWIDDFIKNKKSEAEIGYELPQLKDVLDETYGIILYQEQVMMIANKIASFSMGQADLLRRAMGKKKPEEMAKQKEDFIAGAVRNGISEKVAKGLFEKMEPFAQYGFNKSHSAAYALVAYQTAYLKVHYPVEFMTANLSADMGDTDRIVKLISECRGMSIAILPPDINASDREFKIDGSSVRFGLEAVKGVGGAAIDVLIAERENGVYKTFEDFLKRADSKKINKKVIESLIKAGAFDSLYREPKSVDGACRSLNSGNVRAKAMDAVSAQGKPASKGPGLFGDMGPAEENVQSWDENELLQHEKEALGFYISGHPMQRYRRTLAKMNVTPIAAIAEMQEQPPAETTNGRGYQDDRTDITIAGIIADVKTRAKEKSITAYLMMEDETGSAEALAFSDLYRKNAELLKKGAIILVKGQLTRADKGAKIIVREVQDISGMEIAVRYEVSLRADSADAKEKLATIRALLTSPTNGKDNGSLQLRLILKDFSIVVVTQLQPCSNFVLEVERLTGERVRAY